MPNWTLKELYNSSIRLSNNRKTPPDSPTKKLDKIIPFAGVKTALFQLTMRGVTQYPVHHRINILFVNLDITRDKKDNYIEVKDNYIEVKDKTGTYYVEKPSISKTVCRVRCTCHDFYFTWGIWDFKSGALFGDKPRPYKRKTPPPPVGYPYRNPNQYEGICKHVYNAIKYLQGNRFFIN